MPIEFDDPLAKMVTTRRVLMLCDRWSDWSSGRAIMNQTLALSLCSYGAVEIYRSVRDDQLSCRRETTRRFVLLIVGLMFYMKATRSR